MDRSGRAPWLLPLLLVGMGVPAAVEAQVIEGRVVGEDGRPVAQAAVRIPALERSALTDVDGAFRVERVPPGVYTIRSSALGYGPETRTVEVRSGVVVVEIVLRATPLEVSGLTVTAKPQPSELGATSQSVTALEGRRLDRLRGQTAVETIEATPGVAAYTMGPAIAKPVIRGLTSQRVLVVANGVRQEGQQWGDDHAPELDALDIDRIEVVRGPGSVLYGSDALGGVVNVVRAPVVAGSEGAARLAGTALMNGFSGNRQAAGALELHGGAGAAGYRVQLGGRSAGDVRTPAGMLSNSGFSEANGSAVVGLAAGRTRATLELSRFDQRLEVHDDPAVDPAATAYQRIRHDRATLRLNAPLDAVRWDVVAGWQGNRRREFDAHDAAEPSLHLRLRTATLDARAHHAPIGPLHGTVGVAVMHQANATLGIDPLIPGFDLLDLAVFAFEEAGAGPFTLAGGARVDVRKWSIAESALLDVEAQQRRYRAATGMLGVVWRPAGPVSLAGNVGGGWRAPTASELFAHGVHQGTQRYEIGDAALAPESARSMDVALRLSSGRVQGELALFENRIAEYIYLDPTDERDEASGLRVYRYRQADSRLRGIELGGTVRLASWLLAEAGADAIRGRNLELGAPLPLVPPDRVRLGVRAVRDELGPAREAYAAVLGRRVAAQRRTAEFETSTPGHHRMDVEVGGRIPLDGAELRVDVAVRNALDAAYVDHLSRYREYALEPGRSVMVKVAVPFTAIR